MIKRMRERFKLLKSEIRRGISQLITMKCSGI
jgi:hypothetical protein